MKNKATAAVSIVCLWLVASGFNAGIYSSANGIDATGGVITHVHGKTIHTFSTSGMFTPAAGQVYLARVLVVGGGNGCNQNYSSAGAGGQVKDINPVIITAPSAATVGAGAALGTGGTSCFDTYEAGGAYYMSGCWGFCRYNRNASFNVSGEMGWGACGSEWIGGPGAGGSNTAGTSNAGPGVASDISGTTITYGCGGAGPYDANQVSCLWETIISGSTCGSGVAGSNGADGRGEGGGGVSAELDTYGGDGVVIISYDTP
jgi:fibronectin-binding autotransporter adhesin